MRKVYFWILGLIIIIASALALRLFPVLSQPEKERYGLGPFGDSYLYNSIAVNLYLNRGFTVEAQNGLVKPVFSRGPAYPAFISLIYRIFGKRNDMLSLNTWHIMWDKVRIAQCILDSLVCLLVFFIVKVICPDSLWIPLISSALYSISFYNIYYTRALLSETLTTFLITSFILVVILSIKYRIMRWFFYSGVIFGCVLLCRSEYLIFVPTFALFLLFISKKGRCFFSKSAIIYIIGVLIMLLPWTFRNYVTFKKIFLVSGGLQESLYVGTFYNNTNWNRWRYFPDSGFIDNEEKQTANSLHEVYFLTLNAGNIDGILKLDKKYSELTWRRLMNRPLSCFKNWITKIPRLWYQNYIPMYGIASQVEYSLFFILYTRFTHFLPCLKMQEYSWLQ